MANSQLRCIFCERIADSKEHIWPVWLKPYLAPTDAVAHQMLDEFIYPTHSEVEIKKRTGRPESGRIRCVCTPCNNGWMSELQSAAKPLLIPLIEGADSTLHRNAQTTLAAWVAMFVMVAEFLDRSELRVSVPRSEREWFKENRRTPSNWKIWLGNFERRDWKGVWSHNTFPIESKGGPPIERRDGVDLPNTHSTTIVIGKLYVHAISSQVRFFVHKQGFVKNGPDILPRIWPIKHSPIAWPPKYEMRDADAEKVATAVLAFLRRVAPASWGESEP